LAADPADLALLGRVLVIDNDPSNRLESAPDEAAEAFGERLEIVVSPENSGYAGGNNQGLSRVNPKTEPWFFVLNNDAEIAPGALATLFAATKPRRAKKAFIFAPMILDMPESLKSADDIRVWSAGGVVDLPRGRAFNRFQSSRLSLLENLSAEPDSDVEAWDIRRQWKRLARKPMLFTSGCAFLGRSRALREAGGFDEAFFLYYEDVDLCLRLAQGHKKQPCLVVPTAIAWHGVSKGLNFAPAQEYYNWRNRSWMLRRHSDGALKLRGMLYLAGAALAKILLRAPKPDQWKHAWAIARGASRGLLGRLPKEPKPMESLEEQPR
jgi:hypothetical protein